MATTWGKKKIAKWRGGTQRQARSGRGSIMVGGELRKTGIRYSRKSLILYVLSIA
jgi:hypothetical protein